MTATAVIALLILASCLALLLFGERAGDWLDRRATARIDTAPEPEGDPGLQGLLDERAGYAKRIAAERDPGRRAAWRMLRDQTWEG